MDQEKDTTQKEKSKDELIHNIVKLLHSNKNQLKKKNESLWSVTKTYLAMLILPTRRFCLQRLEFYQYLNLLQYKKPSLDCNKQEMWVHVYSVVSSSLRPHGL